MISNLYAMILDDFVKIGIAKDIEKRRRSLETSIPYDIKIVRWIEYKPVRAYNNVHINIALFVEQQLHEHLRKLGVHHRGEWYVDIKKTLAAHDYFVTQYNPDLVYAKCSRFVEVANKLPKNSKDFLDKAEKEFGAIRPYILERFRKHQPRSLDFLMGDFVDRMDKLVGEQ